jgi:hypothetical protein
MVHCSPGRNVAQLLLCEKPPLTEIALATRSEEPSFDKIMFCGAVELPGVIGPKLKLVAESLACCATACAPRMHVIKSRKKCKEFFRDTTQPLLSVWEPVKLWIELIDKDGR